MASISPEARAYGVACGFPDRPALVEVLHVALGVGRVAQLVEHGRNFVGESDPARDVRSSAAVVAERLKMPVVGVGGEVGQLDNDGLSVVTPGTELSKMGCDSSR